MRLHAGFHAAGIAAFVLCFLFFISSVLNTLVADKSPYALTREDLEESSSAPEYARTQYIPKVIHQVYLGWDNAAMPKQWEKTQESCIEKHPDYDYMLWTNESARALLVAEYPWFLSTWDNYKYPIQRADSIRYFILWHHGGIYIDLDNGCKRNLDPLRSFPAWMPGTENNMGLTNHIMGAMRKHPYFQLLIESLQAYDHNWLLPYMTIMNSAGPHFVSMVWDDYIKAMPRQDEVRILMQGEYIGNAWSFFTKKPGGSWHHWDTEVFAFIGRHVLVFSVICFLSLCGAVSFMWWIGWRLALLLERKILEGQSPTLPLVWQKAD